LAGRFVLHWQQAGWRPAAGASKNPWTIAMFVRFVAGAETENAFWLDGVLWVASVLGEH
jgi:hypothetical protein